MSDETEDQAIEHPQQSDSLEKYLVHGRRQIRQLLQGLIDGHSLISAHLSPGRDAFLTALITLSDDEDWVFLDTSPDKLINEKIGQVEKLICVTQLNKIRIQFSVDSITPMQLDGRPAFAAQVPEQMVRLQRREFYRLHVPLSHGIDCRLPAESPGETAADVRVIDISEGGLAMQLPQDSKAYSVGTIVDGCELHLLDKTTISVRLEVRNVTPQTSRTGVQTQRVGCRFVELQHPADTQIQRYILRTERELNAKERGGL